MNPPLHQLDLPLRSTAAAPPAIEVCDLTVRYDGAPALEHVTFSIPAGSLIGIIGPNGAGKSTLMKAILGLVPAECGEIRVGGAPLARRGGRVAYVPQRDAINWRFPATVAEVVLMGRYGRIGWLRRPGPADRAAVRRALEQVGMASYAARPIDELSGGQQQRVFLARALAQEPDVLLLDEPISGVDAPTQDAVLQILHRLAMSGKTLLLTTHDLRCNMQYFDGLMALNRRLVALGRPDEVLTPRVLAATYGAQLVLADGTEVTLLPN
jgi:ABC-type Mn2+/Zn2+ transport system ATPase subunit